MGWFDKHKPDATKTPEEQSKAEMDALVERFGAAVDEKVKPLRETVEKLQTDWEGIKAEATKTTTTTTQATNADGTPRELTEEEKNKQRGDATIALAIATNARLTESEVISQIAASWPDQVAEIRGHFANTPLQRKGMADYSDYCNNVVDMVIGKAAKKAGLRYDGQNKTFFLEDKSTTATHEEGPLSDPSLAWQQQKPDGSTKTWSVSDQLRALDIDPAKFSDNVKRGVV